MENAVFASLKNRIKPAQIALDGFPWLLATVLYTLSWGWSLLRPNTLYWDDWQLVFRQSSNFLMNKRNDLGLPPWSSAVETLFLPNQIFVLQLSTFALYFFAGIVFFKILSVKFDLPLNTKSHLVLVFLVAPVNHARIGVVMFDYTTSYFFFFLGWWLLTRSKNTFIYILSWACFFYSLKTHSLLFFLIFPSAHFYLIHIRSTKIHRVEKSLKLFFILAIAPIYLLLRSLYWMPIGSYAAYNTPSIKGTVRALLTFLLVLVLVVLILSLRKHLKSHRSALNLTALGLFTLSVALFPYIISDNIDRFIFLYNIGWQSRHLMLTPLGIALVVVGLSQLNLKTKQSFVKLVVVISVLINIFAGTQYYLQSLQQSEINKLLQSEVITSVITEFGDETERFKGRGATYSEYEFFGMLNKADYEYPTRVGYRYVCAAKPDGVKLIVKSDKSFIDALLDRDTGTYLEIIRCADVMSVEN